MNEKAQANSLGRDGTCLDCSSPTEFSSYSHAPQGAMGNDGKPDDCADYYVWCTNEKCPHHLGTLVGDQECPPDWASHDKP